MRRGTLQGIPPPRLGRAKMLTELPSLILSSALGWEPLGSPLEAGTPRDATCSPLPYEKKPDCEGGNQEWGRPTVNMVC